MDLATIEPAIEEQIKRAILPFDNLKDSVLFLSDSTRLRRNRETSENKKEPRRF
jgi:hypothetical protein